MAYIEPNDYIEAFNDEEVIWLRVVRDLLDAHSHSTAECLIKTWSCPRSSAATLVPIFAKK